MFVVPISRRSSTAAYPFSRLLEDRLDQARIAACAAPAVGMRTPAMDVTDTEASFVAVLEMPGVAKEDVKITVAGRRVTVQAEPARPDSAETTAVLIHRERAGAAYARSFVLPADVEQTDTQARLEQGVLTLTLPKRGARNEAQITVN